MTSLRNPNKWVFVWILYVGMSLFIPWMNRVYFLWDDLVFLMRFRDTTLSSFFEHHGYQLHPIFSFFYWLELQLFGVNAPAFLLVAILIHLINLFLIYRLTLLVTKSPFYATITMVLVSFNKSFFTVIYWPTIHSHLLLVTELLLATFLFIRVDKSTKKHNLFFALLFIAGFTQGFGIVTGIVFAIAMMAKRKRWGVKNIVTTLFCSIIPIVATITVSGRDVRADRVIDLSPQQSVQLVLFSVAGVTQNIITRFFLPGVVLNRFDPLTLFGMVAIPLTIGIIAIWSYRRLFSRRIPALRTDILVLLTLWIIAPFSVAALARSKPGLLGSLAERYVYVPFLFFVLLFMYTIYGIEIHHQKNKWVIRSILVGMTILLTTGHQFTLHVAIKEFFL